MSILSSQYLNSLRELFLDRFLQEYDWLLELAGKHSASPILLQGIMESIDKIMDLRREGERICLGLVLSNTRLKMEQPLIERKRFHVSKTAKFMLLKSIVNGSALCYVSDENGIITIRQVPTKLSKNTSRLTLRNISQTYQAIAFYLEGATVEIYDSGKLFRIYRHGVWMEPCIVPLAKLKAKGFPLGLLELVLKLCLQLSDSGKGSAFAIIKGDSPKYCSSMIRECRFRKCALNTILQRQILGFADLDGAIILNTKYEILNVGQKLELPPPSRSYFRESGRGTKHDCAAMYSCVVDSVVFVVSEDGPISLYFDGDLFARCFGELFGNK